MVRTSLTRTLFRTMSTALPSQRQLFFVWAPDKNDEEAFSRRLLVRESHLATAKEHISNGFIRMRDLVVLRALGKKSVCFQALQVQ